MSLTGTHIYGTNIQSFLPTTNKVCVCTHPQSLVPHTPNATLCVILSDIQGDTKKRELLKNPTKIEEIQEKNLLTENEPLKLAF